MSASPLTLTGCVRRLSPLTEVDKNPLRRYFVSLVSLYGDRRPGPAPPAAVSEARAPSVAARRSLPYLEVSPTKTQRRRRGEEAREGGRRGDDTAFPPSYKSLSALWRPNRPINDSPRH